MNTFYPKTLFGFFNLYLGHFINCKNVVTYHSLAQPVKLDLNKKSFPKQETIQKFTIGAQGFRKTKNENPPTWEMGVTS